MVMIYGPGACFRVQWSLQSTKLPGLLAKLTCLQVTLHLKEDQLEFLDERRLKVRLLCVHALQSLHLAEQQFCLSAGPQSD